MPLNLCRSLRLVPILCLVVALNTHAALSGEFTIQVVDGESGEATAARMHLRRQVGRKSIPVRVPRTASWHDHFALDGSQELHLKNGYYTFEIDGGPETRPYTGHFVINPGANDRRTIEIHRHVDMSRLGWWSGDMNVRRSKQDLPVLMRADDLHMAQMIELGYTDGRKRSPEKIYRRIEQLDPERYCTQLAAQDDRGGGILRYYNADEARLSEILAAPSAVETLLLADRDPNVHIDIGLPMGQDVPLWLAVATPDSMTLAGDFLRRDDVAKNLNDARSPDAVLYPPPQGIGRWAEQIYYHAINSGFRFPPSAGSGSGDAPNPVGYNRVYVDCGEAFSCQSWWTNFRLGRAVVTNGPLLRPKVQGQPPGHVFTPDPGETVEFEIALSLSTREQIEYLEIIKDGLPAHTVRLDQFARDRGRLPKLTFSESGWFLIRAVTNNAETYRYATSAPYYVDFEYQPRISRRSVQFFIDWLDAREANLREAGADQLMLDACGKAREFWQQRLAEATTE